MLEHKITIQSLTASVGEAQVIDSTAMILVDHGVKINEAYYRNVCDAVTTVSACRSQASSSSFSRTGLRRKQHLSCQVSFL